MSTLVNKTEVRILQSVMMMSVVVFCIFVWWASMQLVGSYFGGFYILDSYQGWYAAVWLAGYGFIIPLMILKEYGFSFEKMEIDDDGEFANSPSFYICSIAYLVASCICLNRSPISFTPPNQRVTQIMQSLTCSFCMTRRMTIPAPVSPSSALVS